MTATLQVFGASDDLVEMSGSDVAFRDENPDRGSAEYNAYDDSVYLVEGSEGDRAYLYAFYGNEGCWYFSVGQVNEDTPIPAGWAITITQGTENYYSALLTIRAMDKLAVTRVD